YNSANFQKTVHPLATNRWDLAAQAMFMDDWKDAFVKGAGLK
ncbi:minor capsid protein, partial [Streptomyces scabiei]